MDLSADVAETAALAHDIGHPPFGHVAEYVLAKRMLDWGGFEGNAQSFRIVTKLGVHTSAVRGLDLTVGSLGGILKYPQLSAPSNQDRQTHHWRWTNRQRGVKWGVYKLEESDFNRVRTGNKPFERTPEAIIMDWADDITYATHDIDDYVRAGLIPLSRVMDHSSQITTRLNLRMADKFPKRSNEFDAAMQLLKRVPTDYFKDGGASLQSWISEMIERYISAVRFDSEDRSISIDENLQFEVEVLKTIAEFYVIDSPQLAVGQEGQKRLTARLFDCLFEWQIEEQAENRLPAELLKIRTVYNDDPARGSNVTHLKNEWAKIWRRRNLDESSKDYLGPDPRRLSHQEAWNDDRHIPMVAAARTTCDYICSLTEAQAVDLYKSITGDRVGHNFGSWIK